MTYILSIKYAWALFPIVAFFITFPYMIIQYHKYGSISFFRTVLIYLFVLYLITAYFLVILPLPDIDKVARLTTPRFQLIPFNFILDFISKNPFVLSDPSTYVEALTHHSFYVSIFNVLFTMPFGMYLRYYKKTNTKKIIIYTFCFSLFFELTQLTGLYFIYPRSYRLFDIDDLMLNTFGGYLGSLIVIPFTKYLPDITKINKKAIVKGQSVSGLKRTVSFIFDIGIYLIIDFVLFLFTNELELTSLLLLIIYYIIIPCLLNGSTLGQKFINLKEEANSNKKIINKLLIILRKIVFIILYLVLPCLLVFSLFFIFDDVISEFAVYIILGLFITFYLIVGIKFIFTSKSMLYEVITYTKLTSTINEKNGIIDKEV